ncbi:LamG-like jellyroll fold domain-containing protein [Flavobacterium sp. 25HG05S-40]|uniref:LamG-like jellyroll fold domain-containing protein n=1 Tax=Flavobacterium sp. 25HG05S-40 TaxID=3458682 RepID=UPI00404465B4
MKKLLLIIFIMTSAITMANGIPIVNNQSSSNYTTSGCSISFYVDPNGAQTSISIQYNTTNTTAALSVGPQFVYGTALPGQAGQRNGTITGLQPNTTYYWRVLASNIYGANNVSAVLSFTTLSNAAIPAISGISSVPNSTAAAVSYSLNANTSSTTSIVKYGLSDTTLSSQVTGFSATGIATTPGTVSIGGLTPSTVYYYQIQATNSLGTSVSAIGTFTTNSPIIPIQIAQYNFDNTYNNANGNAPFASNTGTSFVTDRNGNANGALNINNSGSTASISGLPYAANARTVSLWFKLNALNGSGFNFLYTYGNSTNYNGAYVNGATTYHFGNNSSHSNTVNTVANVWYHIVMVYDGISSKIYRNGTLLAESTKTWSTVNNSDIFRLGLTENGASTYFNGAVDDLKIYNYAISDADVQSLFSNNTLASQEFNSQNLQATLYPNPTNDAFTIEMKNEVKSVEIYSIQGQKVLTSTSKNINVSDVSKGMYLVRIEGENNAVATQKLIIN